MLAFLESKNRKQTLHAGNKIGVYQHSRALSLRFSGSLRGVCLFLFLQCKSGVLAFAFPLLTNTRAPKDKLTGAMLFRVFPLIVLCTCRDFLPLLPLCFSSPTHYTDPSHLACMSLSDRYR
jgi:hypothetical protein